MEKIFRHKELQMLPTDILKTIFASTFLFILFGCQNITVKQQNSYATLKTISGNLIYKFTLCRKDGYAFDKAVIIEKSGKETPIFSMPKFHSSSIILNDELNSRLLSKKKVTEDLLKNHKYFGKVLDHNLLLLDSTRLEYISDYYFILKDYTFSPDTLPDGTPLNLYISEFGKYTVTHFSNISYADFFDLRENELERRDNGQTCPLEMDILQVNEFYLLYEKISTETEPLYNYWTHKKFMIHADTDTFYQFDGY